MKKQNNTQTQLFAFFCVIVFVLSTTLTIMPTVFAQDEPRSKTTYAYIGAVPSTVGVNQQVLLHVGITDYLATAADGFEGLTVTVTRPDGEIETLGPLRTDSTGGTGAIYIPTMTGTYYLQTIFPAQEYTWASPAYSSTNIYGTIRYEASESEVLELTVQDESITYYSAHSLPAEYWSRPIDAQLREWSAISGNWVDDPVNLYAPYNDAPETAHILWANELTTGGLVGGKLVEHAYECGDAYEGFFLDTAIINGVLYYNKYKEASSNQEVVAIDLHTGEQKWSKVLGTNERLSFGQTMYWDSYNYHGAFDYLWTVTGTTWNAYDAFSGDWVYAMENVPAGTNLYGDDGEIYRYTVDLTNGWMTLWNSSRVVSSEGSWLRFGMGSTLDATTGIEWNVTIPTDLKGSVKNYFLGDRLIGSDVAGWASMGDLPVALWCINLKSGHEGEMLFDTTWTPPAGDLTIMWGTSYSGAPSIEDGVFVLTAKETRQHYGFDLDTGENIWGPTESQGYLDMYGIHNIIAKGRLFSARMAGALYCYNVTTGDLLWTYVAKDPYSEMLWSDNWPIRPMFVSDGKIYVAHSEHSPVDPKPRGAPYVCIDIETGDVVWEIDGAFRVTDWGGRSIIGDSIIATYNSYDQQIYAIGKGPSQITATIANDVISLGSSALITGTVMDVSPGTEHTDIALRFPNGVPAVADESMSEWMLYVHMQFEHPEDATGVTVKLEAIDPNCNYQYLGTTTSDASGFYSFDFVPEIEGKYTIIATFEGTGGYYGSYKETALVVDPAPSVASPIEPEEPIDAPVDSEEPVAGFITTEVAIIAAVAVVAVIGVAAYWFLKRK
jgi:outer membrane protein assembly factor BamB